MTNTGSGTLTSALPRAEKRPGRSGRFFTLWESTYFRRGCRIGYTGLTAMPDTTTKRFVSGPVMAITSPAFNVVNRSSRTHDVAGMLSNDRYAETPPLVTLTCNSFAVAAMFVARISVTSHFVDAGTVANVTNAFVVRWMPKEVASRVRDI